MIWNIILGLALLIIGYLIMPKQKQQQDVPELEGPTVDTGGPIPVLFGDKTIKNPKYLWWADSQWAEKTKRTKKK